MKKSKIFLAIALIFGVLFLINLFLVFDWSDPSWDNNQGAYLTTFSNGVLFVSQFFLYTAFKKKERDE